MSTTMRSTLQTVPESLPADHITNPLSTTATTTAPTETTTTKSSHSHTSTSLKGRTSSTKVYYNKTFNILYFIAIESILVSIVKS